MAIFGLPADYNNFTSYPLNVLVFASFFLTHRMFSYGDQQKSRLVRNGVLNIASEIGKD